MKVYFVVFVLMLVAIPSVLAVEDVPQTAINGPGALESQNRFLAAESVKEIRAAKEEMLDEMKAYQDENFQIFDQRMTSLVDGMLIKFILAGLGAFIAGGAVVALLMQKGLKKYAVERYMEIAAKIPQEDAQQLNQMVNEDFQQMQQPDWYPQPEASNISAQYGQQFASNTTQMNAWQAQAAYNGSWQAPIETQKEHAPIIGTNVRNDPMQSPGWQPRE